jgi:hypothetical protein
VADGPAEAVTAGGLVVMVLVWDIGVSGWSRPWGRWGVIL